MKIHQQLLLILFIFEGVLSHSQQSPVTFLLKNSRNEPVVGATISLTNHMDSTQKWNAVTNDSGIARVDRIPFGQYYLVISAVSFEALEKGLTINKPSQLFSFEMENAAKTMTEVVVRSQRPLMRQEDDKTVVDPEPLAASSTSGFEVMEKIPGLFVDQDGNIYISSMTPAAVQINGREMKMSAADIATLLKSIPPSAITRIEIVRQPSAKYDASGSGGLVNVVLKKGFRLGMTGSIHGGFQQGDYGNQFLGFNINNNDGDKTSFINLNVSRRNSFERTATDRMAGYDSVLSQDARTLYASTNYFAGWGVTGVLPKKWDWDYGGSVSLSDFENGTNNPTRITRESNGAILGEIGNTTVNDGFSLNVRNGITFTKKIDTLDSEWKNDIFHNYTRNESEQTYDVNSIYPVSVNSSGDGDYQNSRNYVAITSDLRLKLPRKVIVETGLKSGLLWFKSRSEYFRSNGSGERIKDVGRTNSYDYDESINAIYLQASKTIGKDFVAKLGVRAENTNMNGEQSVPGDTSFSIHRTDLFPYVYLSKNIMKIFGYDLRAYLIYRRTILRPGYEQLNPFPRYVDQFVTEAGNPSLRPQFTQNFEANVSVDERPIIAVGLNETKDIFTNVVYESDSSSAYTVRTYDNLGKNTEWYLRGLAAIPPGGKYFIVLVSQYNHNFYRGTYENAPLSFKKGTWTFFMYQSLKLDKLSQLTMHGFLRLKGQQQFYELGNFGSLSASINRQFFRQKLIVTLSAQDIFYSQPLTFTLKQGNINARGRRAADSRRFGINLRYNFGIRKKEEPGTPDLNSIPVN